MKSRTSLSPTRTTSLRGEEIKIPASGRVREIGVERLAPYRPANHRARGVNPLGHGLFALADFSRSTIRVVSSSGVAPKEPIQCESIVGSVGESWELTYTLCADGTVNRVSFANGSVTPLLGGQRALRLLGANRGLLVFVGNDEETYVYDSRSGEVALLAGPTMDDPTVILPVGDDLFTALYTDNHYAVTFQGSTGREISRLGNRNTPGEGIHALFGPVAASIDNDELYIVDRWNERVIVANAETLWPQRTWGEDSATMREPFAGAVSGDKVLVLDTANEMLFFSKEGNVETRVGGPTVGVRGLFGPRGMAICPAGLLVADTFNNRIALLHAEHGEPCGRTATPRSLEIEGLKWPRHVAYAHGKLYIADALNQQYICIGLNSEKRTLVSPTLDRSPLPIEDPHAIHVTSKYILLVDTCGLIALVSRNGRTERIFASRQTEFDFSSREIATAEFALDAHDAAWDERSGTLWVADTAMDRVLQISSAGHTLKTLHGITLNDGRKWNLSRPRSLRKYGSELLISDSGNAAVLSFDTVRGRGAIIEPQIIEPMFGPLEWPRDALMLPDRTILVSDYGNSRIMAVRPDITGSWI